jgi:GR25 family glycosyltransferase involved in LPS biosynthesis
LGSAFTDIKVEYVDGIKGAEVDEKTLPPGGTDLNGLGNRGSWRGHLNAIHRVVAEGLESALIMEDDIDWDLRIKDELVDFAKSVHVLKDQQGAGDGAAEHKDFVIRRDSTPPPSRSPYGDSWDVLWLGHCGTRFPEKDTDPKIPPHRAVLLDDATVPEPHYIYLGFGNDKIRTQYPNHTRIVHHTAENVCSLAYAVTQRAARQILWKMSLDKLTGPFDIALRNYCDNDGKVRNCWTIQPSYFNHHRAVGPVSKMSDINDHSGSEEVNTRAVTDNVRWSVRMNLGRLVEEETEFEEQWPDTA